MLTLLLDIDGVIAPTRRSPDSLEVAIDGSDLGIPEHYRIYYRPTVVSELEELRASRAIEIVVLSTWVEIPAMLERLADAIDLKFDRALDGPIVGGWGVVEQNWKRNRAVEDANAHPGRVYVWADDQLTPDDRVSMKRLNSKHVLIVPREQVGLTAVHLQRIRALALKERQP